MVHLKMGAPWKRRFLLETSISRFHVDFQGCKLKEVVSCGFDVGVFSWGTGDVKKGDFVEQMKYTKNGTKKWP